MARILVIPDVHGKDNWKDSVNLALKENDTHIIFLGDYVDHFTIDSYHILKNLKNIINFKKLYPTRITLLIGNHDYAYVFGKIATSGFNYMMWVDYRQLINDNWNLFNMAWGFQGKDKYTLLTHAGLTNTFYEEIVNEINDPETVMHNILVLKADKLWKDLPLHELLNYFADQVSLMWHIGLRRRGTSLSGSILWADKYELLIDRFKGINQIVGHTPGNCIEEKVIDDDRIIFTDVYSCLMPFIIDLV